MNTTASQRTSWLQAIAIITLIVIGAVLIILALHCTAIITLPSYTTAIVIVLYLVTVISTVLITFLGKGKPEIFTQLVLVSTVLKLIIYAAVMFLIGFQKPFDLMANTILFFSLYLVLTVSEVLLLLRAARG